MTDYGQLSAAELEVHVIAIRKALRNRKSKRAKRLRSEIDPRHRRRPVRRTNVYVIELDDAVRVDASFAGENRGCNDDLPCLYVGMTDRTPEERFEYHKRGSQHSRIVKKFGVRLRPEFYERLNPMTKAEAKREEAELATLLRREGYGVWQK